MSKGIIYIMTTAVPGLIKIGKTGTDNFEGRMKFLENNGYRNTTGLKREFAIEVENYDDKEILLHTIFEKSRVSDTELFALDSDIAIQLLSSFEGKQIYPKNISKEKVFTEATEATDSKTNIPDGVYSFKRRIKRWDNNNVDGKMRVSNGKLFVLKGSILCPIIRDPNDYAVFGTIAKRKECEIKDNVLMEDVEFNSVSMAAQFITLSTENGWTCWKDSEGKPIEQYKIKTKINE